jgi:hypothetical protein
LKLTRIRQRESAVACTERLHADLNAESLTRLDVAPRHSSGMNTISMREAIQNTTDRFMATTATAHEPLTKHNERVLTVERAGAILGLSRASSYRAAHRWIDTNGVEGLPVVVISCRRLVVPVAALQRLLETARSIAS